MGIVMELYEIVLSEFLWNFHEHARKTLIQTWQILPQNPLGRPYHLKKYVFVDGNSEKYRNVIYSTTTSVGIFMSNHVYCIHIYIYYMYIYIELYKLYIYTYVFGCYH
jgi:hypothetical protein